MKGLIKFILFIAFVTGVVAGTFVIYKYFGQKINPSSTTSNSIASSEITSLDSSSKEDDLTSKNNTYTVTTINLVENVNIKNGNTMKFIKEDGVSYSYSFNAKEYQTIFVKATFNSNVIDLGSTSLSIKFLNNDLDDAREYVAVAYDVQYVNSLYVNFYIYMSTPENYLPDTVIIELKSADQGYSIGIALIPDIYSFEF